MFIFIFLNRYEKYLAVLLNDGANPRDYEWAVVDALKATVDGDKVMFLHGNDQVVGKLRNSGKLNEIQKFCQKIGTIVFTIMKQEGRHGERSTFEKALNYKPTINKVFNIVLLMQLLFKI